MNEFGTVPDSFLLASKKFFRYCSNQYNFLIILWKYWRFQIFHRRTSPLLIFQRSSPWLRYPCIHWYSAPVVIGMKQRCCVSRKLVKNKPFLSKFWLGKMEYETISRLNRLSSALPIYFLYKWCLLFFRCLHIKPRLFMSFNTILWFIE